MDRGRSTDAFFMMTREDLPILRGFRVGVVIVGNLGWRQGLDAEQRAPGLFGASTMGRVVEASGGVLRDLLTLARQAAYEAMDEHAERVGIEHVERAIDAHRNGCLDGIEPLLREGLRRMEHDGTIPDPSELGVMSVLLGDPKSAMKSVAKDAGLLDESHRLGRPCARCG